MEYLNCILHFENSVTTYNDKFLLKILSYCLEGTAIIIYEKAMSTFINLIVPNVFENEQDLEPTY